jgi:hypothetical protein
METWHIQKIYARKQCVLAEWSYVQRSGKSVRRIRIHSQGVKKAIVDDRECKEKGVESKTKKVHS